MICIYHNADLDGYCSAAICREKYPDIELFGMNYGDEIPWPSLKDQDIILVDFSFQPWSEMERLLETASAVTWIDHHSSAIAEQAKHGTEIPGVRNTTKAACELAWEYFFPNQPVPPGVFLLGDYDCWRHSDKSTMPYQMGMRMLNMDPQLNPSAMETWRLVFEDNSPFYIGVVDRGQTILDYQTQQNEKSVTAIWFPIVFSGLKWMAVNQGGINSKFWDSVWDPGFDGMMGFVRSRKHWTVSLYSETVDCGAIAKEHGGGGHKGAAGFQCQELPFSFPV